MTDALKTTLTEISEALPTLSVIILAGGRSCRMGRDKALLTLPNGLPLLYHTAQVAQRLTWDVIVVTPWPDRYQSALPPQVRLVKEPTTHGKTTGPLSGFAHGLRQISSDWCLLLACDMPYLQSVPLQQWWVWLMARLQRQTVMASLAPTLAPSITPANTKRWEPLCGFYHRSCLSALNQYLSNSPTDDELESEFQQQTLSRLYARLSFQSWLKTLPIAAYTDFPQKILFNCNTPDEWANAHQSFG